MYKRQVWCGASMHAVWNMVMIGGVLHIGPEPDGDALLNYVPVSYTHLDVYKRQLYKSLLPAGVSRRTESSFVCISRSAARKRACLLYTSRCV